MRYLLHAKSFSFLTKYLFHYWIILSIIFLNWSFYIFKNICLIGFYDLFFQNKFCTIKSIECNILYLTLLYHVYVTDPRADTWNNEISQYSEWYWGVHLCLCFSICAPDPQIKFYHFFLIEVRQIFISI